MAHEGVSVIDVPLGDSRPRLHAALVFVAVNLLASTLAQAPVAASSVATALPPAAPLRATLTWTQDRPFYYQDEKPFGQTDWPNPALRPDRLTVSVATRPSTDAVEPHRPLAWPVPAQARPLTPDVGLGSRLVLDAVVPAAPVAGSPLAIALPPTRPAGPAQTWTQARPGYYQDVQPISLSSWPNPPRAMPRAPWLSLNEFYVFDETAPTVPVAWPNPQPARRPALSFTAPPSLPLLTAPVESIPIGLHQWPVPGRARPQTLSWTQARPTYYADTPAFAQTDWPNPALSRPAGLTWTQGLLPGPLAPALAAAPLLPVVFDVPMRSAASPATLFAPSPLVLAVTPAASPFSPPFWALPLRARALVLDVAAGGSYRFLENPKPFDQSDWPNPLRALVVPGTVWTPPRQSYLVEQPPIGATEVVATYQPVVTFDATDASTQTFTGTVE